MTASFPVVPAEVPVAEVGPGEQVGRGGASTVFALAGERKSLLYKKYDELRGRVALDHLVHVHTELDVEQAAYARERLAWPVAVVLSGGRAVGTLVVRAGAEFHFALPTGRTRVRDLNHLLYEKRSERLGVVRATDRQKVELLRELVAVLSWLDVRGLVHEDLAAHNVLWSLDPPAVFVLDCDSVRAVAVPSDQPLYTTVDWTDPRVLATPGSRPDRASTSYLLGLLSARVLVSPYWHPGDPLPGDRVPAALVPLVAGACGPVGDRPSLAEWSRAVGRALPQTVNEVVEPEPVADPRAGGTGDRVAFLVGLLVGMCVAVYVLVGFL
ncbi:hypothetical protein [Actinosynnema sp. NPDC020468]|uniref:hypothetical protein n=1 Tax=Actinosynnema sp. NPDC020468 TaxID=3154488 RepID=UPI0033DAC5DC